MRLVLGLLLASLFAIAGAAATLAPPRDRKSTA
jgi:hypothetical protein